MQPKTEETQVVEVKAIETAPIAETSEAKVEARKDPQGDALPPGALARLGTLRFRATAFAHAIAASPDGTKFASGHIDGVLRIFDATTGAILYSWPAHEDGVIELAWASDNSAIYSGGRDGKVIAWTGTGQKIKEAQACDGEMSALAIAPNAKTIAAGCPNKEELRLLTVPELSRSEPLTGHGDRVDAIAFSQDSKTIASGGYGGTIVVRDTNATSTVKASIKRGSPIFSLAIAPDAKSVAAGGEDAQIAIFDIAGKKQLAKFRAHTGGVTALAFSDDGRAIFSAGADGRVKKLDTKSGKTAWDAGGNKDQEVSSIARLSNKKELVTGGAGGTLHIWSEDNGKEARANDGHADRVLGTAFSASGDRVVSCGADGFVRVWLAESGKSELAIKASDKAIEACAFTPDDRGLIAVDAAGERIELDAKSGAKTNTKRADNSEPRARIAISPDTKTIVETLLDGTVLPKVEKLGKLAGVAFSDNNAVLIDANMHAVDSKAGTVLFELNEKADVATLGSNTTFACTKAKTFQLAAFDLKDGKATKKRAINFPAHACGTLALSPSGDTLAVAAGYNHVRPRVGVGEGRWQLLPAPKPIEVATKVFDPQKLEDAFALIGHDGGVEMVAFSPDGTRIATAGDDTTVLIWSLRAVRGK